MLPLPETAAAGLVVIGWVVVKTGGHQVEMPTLSRTTRLRRRAYHVALRSFGLHAPTAKSRDAQRFAQRAHERQLVPKVKRAGRHVTYAEIHYPLGHDTGEKSQARRLFEACWSQDMTRASKGMADHRWEFKWYVGSPVVACRAVPLPPPLPFPVPYDPALVQHDALPVGVNREGEVVRWRYTQEGSHHASLNGQTGAGKTIAGRVIVVGAYLAGFQQVIVLDPKAGPDWAWLAGYPRVRFAADLPGMLAALKHAEETRVTRSSRQMQAAAAHRPEVTFPPILVYVDEATALFISTKGKDARSRADDEMRGLAQYYVRQLAGAGRSASIHVVVAAHRPLADFLDSSTKFNLGYRVGLGNLDAIAARMIFDRQVEDEVPPISVAGRGYVGAGGAPTETQVFHLPRDRAIELLGPLPKGRDDDGDHGSSVGRSDLRGADGPGGDDPAPSVEAPACSHWPDRVVVRAGESDRPADPAGGGGSLAEVRELHREARQGPDGTGEVPDRQRGRPRAASVSKVRRQASRRGEATPEPTVPVKHG